LTEFKEEKMDRKDFLNPTTWQAIRGYTEALQEELRKFSGELEREFFLLKEKDEKREFTVNGVVLSMPRFTLLLGIKHYENPGFSIRTLGLLREETLPRMKKEIIQVENYLLMLPGAIIPPVPEILREWLQRV
jgi:hypothetical protein